jgi:hypothetical protein
LYVTPKTIDEESEVVGREPGKDVIVSVEGRALISLSMSGRAFFELTFTIIERQAGPCRESATRGDGKSQVKAHS